MKKINGDPKTIRELFTGVKYTIHYYQREYQWGIKQIEELIDDLIGEFLDNYSDEHELKGVAHYEHYFMGSIVLTTDENAVIDGQQRLTSLSLLLMYLYHKLESIEDKSEVLNLFYSKKHGETTYNINVEEREDCLNAIKNNTTFEIIGQPESVRNIYRRYQDIEDLILDALPEQSLPFFKDWLIDKVVFIRIEAQTEQDAHKIFVSMNDRGLSLTPVEMLKGYLLSEISDDNIRQKANNIWKEKILELKDLGKEEDSDCIKNWLRSQYAENIRERKKGAENRDYEQISSAFHKWVRENTSTIGLNKNLDFENLVIHEFIKYADAYILIQKYSNEYSEEFEYVFYNANRKFTLQTQLLLAAINPEDTKDIISKKIRLVSCFIDQYITRRIFNFKTIDYSSMLYTVFVLTKKLRRKNLFELLAVLKEELKNLEYSFKGVLNFRLNGWTKRYMLHFLARITHFVEKKSGMDTRFDTYVDRCIKNAYDIEHIWADHYERHKDEFETEDQFLGVRNKFGGLLILPRDINRSLNDKTYEEKLPKYYAENLLAKSLNKECYSNKPNFIRFNDENKLPFKPYESFTKTSIEERQKLYMSIAEIIWATKKLDSYCN
jgi:uncharacterized protein with ParB-like and HNH nuclease domain